MYRGLYKTVLKKSFRSFHFACWNKRSEIAESIINLACRLKNEMHDVTVSTIILRTDDKKLNEKGMEVNLHLKELCKEKYFFKRQRKEDLQLNILTKVNYI